MIRLGKHHITIFLFLILGCGLYQGFWAQSNADLSKQIWLDFNPSYLVKPGLKIFGDIGTRREFENDGWWRLVLRPSVQISFGKRYEFITGIGNFYTFNEIIADRWELRPFQGLRFTWPHGKFPLRHYIRLEERFDFNTATWNSRNSVRLRYQLLVSYQWKALRPGRFWQLSASGEGFLTLLGEEGQFRELSRVTVGLDRSYTFDLHIRFELTWQQERFFFNKDDLVSDIYFRFRLYKGWTRSNDP